MRRTFTILVLTLVGLPGVTGGAYAAEPESEPFARLGPIVLAGDGADALQFAAGAFNFDEDDISAALNLEYRFGRKLFFIGPSLGILANDDGGIYGYFGLYADLALGSLHLTPQVAAGGYAQGDGKDLGGVFEFRESLDIAWRFAGGTRLGARIAHISNAGIHDINPGVNEIYLTFALPLGPVF